MPILASIVGLVCHDHQGLIALPFRYPWQRSVVVAASRSVFRVCPLGSGIGSSKLALPTAPRRRLHALTSSL
jgi:hypothetical protein